MGNDAVRAREFVVTAELPPEPSGLELFATDHQPIFDAAKDQAAVVGAEVVAFIKGVTTEARHDIVNATLLAQLVAKRKVPAPGSLAQQADWYHAYFDALTSIGFVVQDTGFARYQERTDELTSHEAILEVATVLLGAAPAALAILESALTALKKAIGHEPWITIFDRESRTARTGRFQIALVEETPEGQLLLSLLAFAVEARHELTQVLFFKFRKNQITLEHNHGKVTINPAVLAGIRGALTTKLVTYAGAYISELPL